MKALLNNKKILIVCNSTFAFNNFLNNFVTEIKKFNNEIFLAVGKDNQNKSIKFYDKNNIFFIDMPKRNFTSVFSFIKTTKNIIKIINKTQVDIVLSNNRDASFCTRLGIFFIKKRNFKNVYFARGFYFHDGQNILKWFLSYIIEFFLLLKTDYILSQSKEDIKKINYVNFFLKVPIYWVGNGVNKLKYKYYERNINLKNIEFSTTCRITKGKGLEDLIQVFLELCDIYTNINLTIIGGPISKNDQYFFNNLKNIIKKNKYGKKIKFTGITENVYFYLNKSNFYVHPSYREGMPKSLIEAMSIGLVPIASRIRGSREIINNNINGFLFKSKSKNQLKLNLQKVLNLNENEYQKISYNSFKSVEIYDEKSYLKRQIYALSKAIS